MLLLSTQLDGYSIIEFIATTGCSDVLVLPADLVSLVDTRVTVTWNYLGVLRVWARRSGDGPQDGGRRR